MPLFLRFPDDRGFHRVLMMLAVVLTIAAIVLIFYKIGQWSVTENPHPILGIVCAALGVIQPIMALFRCHPHEDNRYIFNWLHWFNGNAAQIIGAITSDIKMQDMSASNGAHAAEAGRDLQPPTADAPVRNFV
ncbi:hypothetical protein HPB48_002461 [Haemaphysalis longicornis]|uniref:Cytochrome b561 domain-containing protein n=1 Tax=Haemaphysalis longicornis TaxID=44386 RepID=A0A9J6FUM0_HAELO|nr:hypothetical protein HPB48_002461 [Haemaphysalis longicornis]